MRPGESDIEKVSGAAPDGKVNPPLGVDDAAALGPAMSPTEVAATGEAVVADAGGAV